MTEQPSIGPGRMRQGSIYRAGTLGRRPRVPTAWSRLEEAARRSMSPAAYAYVAGSAGLEATAAANQAAFDRWQVVPRAFHDVRGRTLYVELFGRRLPAPLLLAPIGVLEMAHPDADLAVGRAGAGAGLPVVLSSQSSIPMETVTGAMGDGPRWFQLYASSVDDLSDSFLRRAEAAGCEAIVLTVDTTQLGWRCRDLDLGYLPFAHGLGIAQYTSDPVFARLVDEHLARPSTGPRPKLSIGAVRTLLDITRSHPGGFWANLRSPRPRAAVETFLDVFSRPGLSWPDLARLRAQTRLPLLVKGLLHPDDARHAVELGADGIIVSNHGGRQVDGSIAALDALPGIVGALAPDVPVLMDSGIRSGSDVVKALCLGARAVLVGRPYVYGLALGGEQGVRDVLDNLVADLDITLGLMGCTSIADLTLDCLADIAAGRLTPNG
jgi:isopentenyl diphosphate isomerase/L-lactate dehydrogenase-like FMN-dependent dehydrogenase